jgi:hypothetical protein
MAQNHQNSPELSTRLNRTNRDLKDLQYSVRTGMINVKVLVEFRRATECARQAGIAVQHWLETQAKGSDPYKLMSQVTGQRVEMATQLLHDIINDLDGGDLEFGTPGLPELHRTVQTLAERMSRPSPK